jgi:hypothetical protein
LDVLLKAFVEDGRWVMEEVENLGERWPRDAVRAASMAVGGGLTVSAQTLRY